MRTSRLALLAALTVSVPLLAYLIRFGVAAPLSTFQSDAFYYLDIARNSAGQRGFSFDGLHPTNGFHPLWQYILSASTRLGLLDFFSPFAVLTHVFVIQVLFLSIGAAIFTAFASRLLHLRPLALLVVTPGPLWFFASPITPVFLSSWSYANGMESAISLAAMSTAIWLWSPSSASIPRDLLFSMALGSAVLARLDDIFFFVAILIWGALFIRVPLRRIVLWFVPAALVITTYLVYNRLSVGVFLPLSGAAKAGFALGFNLRWTLKLLIPMLTKNPPSVISETGRIDHFQDEAIRAFQMVVPMLLCTAQLLLPRLRRYGSASLHALCLGVVLKAMYNLFFVYAFAQGVWYYTTSVAVANLVLVLWLDSLLAQLQTPLLLESGSVFAYLLLVGYSFSAYYGAISTGLGPARYRLIKDGPAIGARLRQRGDRCFTEIDDGVVSFALQMPAEAGLGLALDLQATRALHQARLVPLLQQRGCTLVATFAYDNPEYITTQAWKRGIPFWTIAASEFERYDLVPVATIPYDSLSFYRLKQVAH